MEDLPRKCLSLETPQLVCGSNRRNNSSFRTESILIPAAAFHLTWINGFSPLYGNDEKNCAAEAFCNEGFEAVFRIPTVHQWKARGRNFPS
jgi:hypothetical protein